MSEVDPSLPPDPRYIYRDIRPPAIPEGILDGIAKGVFDPGTVSAGWVGWLIAGIKLTIALVYLAAREKLVNAQLAYTKQRYELEQARKNQTDLDRDNLSGEIRPTPPPAPPAPRP